MANMVKNNKQPGVIFLKGKAYYNKGTVVGGGGDKSSTLTVIEDPYDDMQFIDFDNDNRFELSYDNHGEWHQRDLFQDENGNNMYSPMTAPPGYEIAEFYIKNITSKPIYFKLYYDRDTEGPTYDYGIADIRQYVSRGRENIIVNGDGLATPFESIIFCLPSQYTLVLAFREDSGGRRGKDNIGFTAYEVKEV